MGVGARGRQAGIAPGSAIATIELRPQVPMGAMQTTGFVCALGVVDALDTAGFAHGAIGWPHSVVDGRTHRPLLDLRLKAGYDGGMFVACEVVGDRQVGLLRRHADALVEALAPAVEARVDAWAQALGGSLGAGPLAPVLSDYFDRVSLMGEQVDVVYPNGRVMATGRLTGMDVWGRAAVTTDDGRELELAPEQAGVRPAAI